MPFEGVTSSGAASSTASAGITRPSSLLLAHAPHRNPLADLGLRPIQRAFAGCCAPCWESLDPGVISAILVWVLGPLPRGALSVHMPVPSRETPASPQRSKVRRARHRRNATSTTEPFRGCRQFVMFRLPYLLGPPIAPTAGVHTPGRPGRLHHAYPGSLPAPGRGIATCPTRAN